MRKINLFIAIAVLFLSCSASRTVRASDESTIYPELRGDGVLTLFRPAKNERGTFRYRDKNGFYNEGAFDRIARFFRCRLTGEAHPIDPELIEILDAIEDHFQADELKLISAFRSPIRNALMRRKGRRVASRSLHMFGRAADIEIDGISPIQIRNFAYTLKGGGVGYYGRRRFVHVDTGPLRAWGFAPPATSRSSPATAHK